MLKLVPADLFEAVLIAPEDEVRQNARFIQESTRDGAAFLSGSEGGRGFGSVFRHKKFNNQPSRLLFCLFPVFVVFSGKVHGCRGRREWLPVKRPTHQEIWQQTVP